MWFSSRQLQRQCFEGMLSEEGTFNWNDEMDRDASVPASDPALFPHMEFTQRRFAEFVLYRGRPVWARNTDGTVVRGVVQLTCGRSVLLDVDSKGFFYDLMEIVRDPQHVCSMVNGGPKSLNSPNGESNDSNQNQGSPGLPVDDLSDLECRDMWLAVADIAKVGKYLELQDIRNPLVVHIAKITENRGGLLTVISENARQEKIFLTNERCHGVGWGLRGEQDCDYAEGAESLVRAAAKNAVPPSIFSQNPIREHKFEVGMAVEVLDASNGGVFYPGYVCSVLNSHYFRVRISQTLSGPAREIVCHRSHPYIFPVYWCEQNGLRLTPPEDFGEEFSWSLYRSKCGATRGNAPENFFDLPRNPREFDKLRNIEVLDIRSRDVLYPGKIVRSMGHLVWVHLSHYANATPPAVFSTRSQILFPCGFAKRYGIRMQEPSGYVSIEPSTSEDRFNLRMLCTSRQTPVFITPKKRFLSSVWLKGDLWLPIVYVRKGCFAGPFINPDRFRQSPDRYQPGPMPAIIRGIISDLICSAYKPKDMCDILSCSNNSKLPTIYVKARIKFKRYRVRVECCEQLTEFCGWLRSICVLLDACPDLYSIRNSPCESYCNTLRNVPSMNTFKHVWTAPMHTVVHKSIPRRVRRSAPSFGSTAPVIKKKKKKTLPLQSHELSKPRRPLTRALANGSRSRSATMTSKAEPSKVKENMKVESAVPSSSNSVDATAVAAPAVEVRAPEPRLPPIVKEEPILVEFPAVTTNPKLWTKAELASWIQKSDVAPFSSVLEKEEVDGEAFMLLTLNDCIEHLDLKLGPALKLCALITKLKSTYDSRFLNESL